ncbi:hypothetical protein [Methanobrevibacter sp.]|uniref:hypothetical protein n=1 Tax=Methanobrevibacter sp. TaxID=66852 RepID=UPI0038909EAC
MSRTILEYKIDKPQIQRYQEEERRRKVLKEADQQFTVITALQKAQGIKQNPQMPQQINNTGWGGVN